MKGRVARGLGSLFSDRRYQKVYNVNKIKRHQGRFVTWGAEGVRVALTANITLAEAALELGVHLTVGPRTTHGFRTIPN